MLRPSVKLEVAQVGMGIEATQIDGQHIREDSAGFREVPCISEFNGLQDGVGVDIEILRPPLTSIPARSKSCSAGRIMPSPPLRLT